MWPLSHGRNLLSRLATAMPSHRYAWPPLCLATTTMSGHHHYIRMALGLYTYYPRVEISRIDRFRAYLGGDIEGRPPRDLPSTALIIEL